MTSLVLFVSIMSAFGAQEYRVKNNASIKVKISRTDLTRIIVHRGRVTDVWATNNTLTIDKDDTKGELFIRAKASAPYVTSFFVKDDQDRTYTLVAEQSDLPAQTIVLRPSGSTSQVESAKHKSTPYLNRVKAMMISMAKRSPADDCDVSEIDERIDFWAETRARHLFSYTQGRLQGHIYRIQNITKKELSFTESEFLALRPGAKAIALEKPILKPGESSEVYVLHY